ncbi:probable carboxylesterase 12 [Punica granatum]|uniref:Probable carboxylesterase 12 n=1 Tax=Punica granatum TaxID=22663 RepID=A0A6P8D738_PUNGR|nr:probable carboxylesterase 12 [Punica granatum]
MEKADESIAHDLSPFLRIYKDGRVERLIGKDVVPPSKEPTSPGLSKDVAISPEPTVSVRLYLPNNPPPSSSKLPVLVYFHGGGFMIGAAVSSTYHNYLNVLAVEARVIIVSVEYRLAPECPIPAAYDDSWAAIKWVGSHFSGLGYEEEIKLSNGTGIGFELAGLILVHPYFWGNDPLEDEATEPEKLAKIEIWWRLANPTTTGFDDPYFNPGKDLGILRMGCSRILACVAKKDELRARGWYYKEVMEKSRWEGEVEVMEANGEDHVFHLINPTSENAIAMMKRLVEFMNDHR